MRRVRELGSAADEEDFVCVEHAEAPSAPIVAAGTEGGCVCLFDTRSASTTGSFRVGTDAVNSIALSRGESPALFVACGAAVASYDLRQAPTASQTPSPASPVFSLPPCDEEANHIALNRAGDRLAAADDSGAVLVYDLAQRALLRRLRGRHTNIATGVAFRPNRTSELISCGLDARMVLWDHTTGRCRRAWELSEAAAEAEAAAAAEGVGGSSLGPMVNPPLAHMVAVGEKDERGGARLAAVACGDGTVLVLQLEEAGGKDGGKGARRPAGGAAGLEGSRAGSSGGAGGTGRGGSRGRGAGVRALGRSCGGHTSGVAHVAFPRFSGGGGPGAGPLLLLSGGNDGRVLLWDVTGGGEREGRPRVAAEAAHGKKVNWMANAAGGDVVVADPSPQLTLYTILGS